MKRTTLVVALAVVVATVGVLPAAAVQTDAESASAAAATTQTGNASAGIAPGARLSGVVGVQEAEIDGEVESRAFGQQVAGAATDDAKARVVGRQLTESSRRLDALERRLEELERARENGSISNDTYAARAAVIEARLDNVRRMSNETESASEGLPREVLEANGVNVTAIDALRQRAAELTGPEVAAIARTIAGPGPGAPDRGADSRVRGPPGNETAERPGENRTADGDATRTAREADGTGSGDGTSGDGADSGSDAGDSDGY